MKLVGREVLSRFWAVQPDCRRWISAWIADVEHATWKSPQGLKDRYATVSFLANNVVIFNVRGNNHRLVARIAYNTGVVLVEWIGPHAEYDKKYC